MCSPIERDGCACSTEGWQLSNWEGGKKGALPESGRDRGGCSTEFAMKNARNESPRTFNVYERKMVSRVSRRGMVVEGKRDVGESWRWGDVPNECDRPSNIEATGDCRWSTCWERET